LTRFDPYRNVGEIRPSQLLHTFGIGAVVDLPNISAMVMGLDEWSIVEGAEIPEDRLLAAVRNQLGHQVVALRPPPESPDVVERIESAEVGPLVGVPIMPFPG
jgi:hypothetical protein